MKFLLGRIVATPSIIELVENQKIDLRPFIAKHASGDFGDIQAESVSLNDKAISGGEGNILSQYSVSEGICLWISTELNGVKAITTILLPSDN